MWCGRELSDNRMIARLCAKVRGVTAPLFRKGKSERTPHLEKCFEAWLAEVQRADQAQDGSDYRALPVLQAIAAGRMPTMRKPNSLSIWERNAKKKMPAPHDTIVQVKDRRGTISEGTAGSFLWEHAAHPNDIMEYRLMPPERD